MAWPGTDGSSLGLRSQPQNISTIETKLEFCTQVLRACVAKGHIPEPTNTSAFIKNCAIGLPKGGATRVSGLDGNTYNVFPRGRNVISKSIGPASDQGSHHAMQTSANNLAEPKRCRYFSKDDGPGGNPAVVTEVDLEERATWVTGEKPEAQPTFALPNWLKPGIFGQTTTTQKVLIIGAASAAFKTATAAWSFIATPPQNWFNSSQDPA
ncbi:MAG: hypothetical protein COV45_06755 [Deltaproteobacteria bacterium CG11_big_fil_rev_8_21_14_0_20_47_16]|nr:MAG: hypothetical protein COV45_06755 [Deltaproteobacteria bacterium CG11_big_fil_rev_8_21_14_0_20_47_16]